MNDLISRQAAIDVVKGIDSGFVKYIEELPSAEPEQWNTCFDCPLSHGCPVINGCTNEQAMEYAGEIPDNCPLSAEPQRKERKRM